MKIDFYHEAITEKFERLTVLGIQVQKLDRYALHLWFMGFGVQIIF